MENVYKELDDVRAELEKIKEEHRIKSELCRSLKKAHGDHLAKYEEVNQQLERLAKDLSVKVEEAAEARKLYEDTKSELLETNSSLKLSNSVSEKFRVEFGEKMKQTEEDKKKLVSALDETTLKNSELEKQLCACIGEIQDLKRLLSDSQRKCQEAELKVEVRRVQKVREEALLQLEEQSMSVQEQLKWKKEQFDHLEEAHQLLQVQFRSGKENWENEKASLMQEISSLQDRLDTQIRANENLKSELQMCHQALAHEESRRRLVEAQLSESKVSFENVLMEWNRAKEKIENLSLERDEEVANLRSTLGTKKSLLKEMEFRVSHLEQDNKELLQTVKELQEAQIGRKKTDPSQIKLRNKLRDLEREHVSCTMKINEIEAEWSLKMENVVAKMNGDLKIKSERIHQLENQLEDCHSLIELSAQERSILFTVLKSELSEAYSSLCGTRAPDEEAKEQVEPITVSHQEEQVDHSSLSRSQFLLEQAGEEIASLTQKLKYLTMLEQKNCSLESEVDRCKKMLMEYSTSQLHLKEQASLMEVSIKTISDDLTKSKSELALKTNEVCKKKEEAEMWKSEAESMGKCLEQQQEICKQLKASLLGQTQIEQSLRKDNSELISWLEERDRKVTELQSQATLLGQELGDITGCNEAMKVKLNEALKREENYLQLIEVRDAAIQLHEREKACLEEEAKKRESLATAVARSKAEKSLKPDIEKLHTILIQKNQDIAGLRNLTTSMEQQLESAFFSSFSESVEMLVQCDVLREALLKAEYNASSEIEAKNSLISKLESKVANSSGNIAHMKDLLIVSEQRVQDLKILLDKRNLEVEKLKGEFEDEKSSLTKQLNDLEITKQVLLDDVRNLSLERENIFAWLKQVSGQVEEFYEHDANLMGSLGRILQNSEGTGELAVDAVATEKLHDSSSWGAYCSKIKEVEDDSGNRSPLMVLNQ